MFKVVKVHDRLELIGGPRLCDGKPNGKVSLID